MARLIIHVNDPKKEKEVAEILLSVGGVEIERAEASPKKTAKGKTIKRKLTERERRFVAELRQAIREVNASVAGKKKLQSARAFLNEL